MKTIAIITQARTSSKRFPKKILQTINGKTLLEYHIERLLWSNLPVIVATTDNPADKAITNICKLLNIPFFRGDEFNVLSRYYYAAKKFGLATIIRVTTDCPLIDGFLISDALRRFSNCDYLSNTIHRTFPRGMDFEIFTFRVLEKAFQNSTFFHEKEHVTPYIHTTNPKAFQIKSYDLKDDYSDYRITVDTKDDFIVVKELIEKFKCNTYDCKQIVSVLCENKYLVDINNCVHQKVDKLYFRLATEDDISIVYDVLNDPIVRQYSFAQEPFSFSDHKKWFADKLRSDNYFIFIFTLPDQIPIAVVRLEITQDKCAEVSIAIDQKNRGKKYSSKMINLASEYAFDQLALKTLVCHIRTNNTKSVKVFTRAGYHSKKMITYKNIECFELRRLKQ